MLPSSFLKSALSRTYRALAFGMQMVAMLFMVLQPLPELLAGSWQDTDNDGDPDTFLPDPGELDTDNDGIPDLEELLYGLDPEDPADALLDLDGDGFTNLKAYSRNWALNAALVALDDLDEDGLLDIIEAH